MSDSTHSAARCLVPVCCALCLMVIRDDEFRHWLAVLRDLLSDDFLIDPTQKRIKYFAQSVVFSDDPEERRNNLYYLEGALQDFFAKISAERIDLWQKSKGGYQ